jgi:hypothetical protein
MKKGGVESILGDLARRLALLFVLGTGGLGLLSGGEGPKLPSQAGAERQTEMDLPGDFNKYFGQRVNQFRDSERRVAKLDMDADLSYDGVIDGSDPADGGAFEQTPPGLVIGTGELSRFLVRVNPYRIDFEGSAVLTLEVAAINRDAVSGRFDSFDQEVAATGRIRVWKNADCKELLLDSADPQKRFVEWVADHRAYPANLPSIYPRFFYVEGVKASPKHKGDLRVLVTISHRVEGESREAAYGRWVSASTSAKDSGSPSDAGYKQSLVKSFRTSFDHILVTVSDLPHEKVFVNNNAQGHWIVVADRPR